MRDPFERASRRIIRRLGQPVQMVTSNGVRLDPAPRGVFSNAEQEVLSKSKSGGLTFTQRLPSLAMLTSDVQGLDKEWRIILNGVEYFAADWKDDGAGVTNIDLALKPQPAPSGDQDDGNTWR
jgi:hypothetical protein